MKYVSFIKENIKITVAPIILNGGSALIDLINRKKTKHNWVIMVSYHMMMFHNIY